MRLSALFPAITLYLIGFIFAFAPVTAHPFSRFTHHIERRDGRHTHRLQAVSSRDTHLIASRASQLHRRGLPGAVYICTDQNFRGDCSWVMPSKECHIAGTGDKGPESIGPDPGGFCNLYSKADCTGNQVQSLRFPGLGSALPQFAALKCFADGQAGNATGIVQNGGVAGSGVLPAGKAGADPRLAGGVGSMERKKLEKIMEQMEKDGFKQGMIGLKKGHYY